MDIHVVAQWPLGQRRRGKREETVRGKEKQELCKNNLTTRLRHTIKACHFLDE
ncbi:hypothetical protein EXN66_Car018463 [Channa argus]|uniref:Uncharacterized protein n=1 Tax=Channa argus TaxID=215402 RepID=A0A6G1QJQ0_CHAAH|nr:hypothetical protein EXN66_Car018463 [Channa argus]